MKKSRWLSQILILSSLLNILLLFLFFYFVVHDNPLQFAYCPKIDICNPPALLTPAYFKRLKELPYERLLELLAENKKIEGGLHIRDLALGALVTFHDFDLERALKTAQFSKKKMEIEGESFFLFLHLKEADFAKISTFAAREQWPFTHKGIFKIIQNQGFDKSDPQLVQYFFHTPEFLSIQNLFERSLHPLQKTTLLSLLMEGNWDLIQNFHQKQTAALDFSETMCSRFLLSYVENNSRTAAYLLLRCPHLMEASNELHLAKILSLLDVKTPESLQFAQKIALHYSNPLKEMALDHIAQTQCTQMARCTAPPLKQAMHHIIAPGESLWLIAKKHQVSLDSLMQLNGLNSTVIQPGKTLKIPS